MAEEKKPVLKKVIAKKPLKAAPQATQEVRFLKKIWKQFTSLKLSYKVIIILIVIGFVGRVIEKL
ncbi:MAG: hypothetical protein NTV32_02650 [Gammaproteobacteria bacterium]|jgi:hypothetical protein|nr:hypothetical protein [Gammaproteobacteria bacterium]